MISAKRVREIFMDCLYKTAPEEMTPCIGVYDMLDKIAFIPEKIEEHRNEIFQLLQELPETFFEDIGGGWSFTQLPFTKDGTQWGEQTNGKELMDLGLATGYMQYLFPIEIWRALPGGVPYVIAYRTPKPVKIITIAELSQNEYSITGAWEKSEEEKK